MNFSAFYDDVLSECSRATAEIALNAIRNATIELCTRSRIWTFTTVDQSATVAVADYALTVPVDSEVVEVLSGYYNGYYLPHRTQDQLDFDYSGKWQALTGAPRVVTTNVPGTVTVVPIPDATLASALKFRVALRPTRTAAAFDPSGVFSTEHYETILHGALARLMTAISKPYSNAKAGQHHEGKFMAGLNRARVRANASQGRADMHVEFPRYI